MSVLLDFLQWLGARLRYALDGFLRLVLPSRRADVVRLRLEGALQEGLPPSGWFGLRLDRGQYLLHVLECLDRAGRDPQLRAIWITLGDLAAGWATLQSLRAALVEARGRGKKVLIFFEHGGNGFAYLASAADRVVMAPPGALDLTGLHAEVLFLRGALDRARIESEFIQLGEYKSAAEPLMRDSLSPAAREALDSILDDLYEQVVAGIAEGRNLEPDRVKALIDAGPYRAEEAVAAQLVDELLYEDQVEEALGRLIGMPDAQPVVQTAGTYVRAARRLPPPEGTRIPAPRVALLLAEGFIRSGHARAFPSRRTVASGTFIEAIRAARDDRRVQAIVLRVDSPGGSSLASDVIWRELRLAREKKPLVVSMGNVAASGGYYLAMAGDWVVTEGATLTGSIGVIAGKFNLRGLYNLLGLSKETLDRGARAGSSSDYRPLTREEREKLEADIRSAYEAFVAKAAECRGMDRDTLEKVARGRVWTGRQALGHRLVDELGGIRTAIAAAKRRAGIPFAQPVQLQVYPRTIASPLDALLRNPLRALPGTWREPLELAEDLASLREGAPLALGSFLLTLRSS